MTKTIYYMHKPDEERDFVLPKPPDSFWLDAQLRAGYRVYAVTFEIPDPRVLGLSGEAEFMGIIGDGPKIEVG